MKEGYKPYELLQRERKWNSRISFIKHGPSVYANIIPSVAQGPLVSELPGLVKIPDNPNLTANLAQRRNDSFYSHLLAHYVE